MAKLRLIPTMLLARRRLVKGRRFSNHEDAGNPVTTAKIYNDQMADEIAVLDIEASPSGREPDLEVLQDMTHRCFVPVAFGGGVSSVGLARKVLRAGADKVIVNSAALQNPLLIGELAVQFGRQAVVVAIDFLDLAVGPRVATACGTRATSWHPVDWAKEACRHGAGEILLTAVDREGNRGGLDLAVTRSVSDAISIPVIAHGGVGQLQDFADGFVEGLASAVAAGRTLQFADNNLIKIRRYLQQQNINLRSN